MPHLTRRSKTRARPLSSDAAYAKRGRGLAERKAQEHQRAREKREARGEVRIQTYVPAVHEDLIRGLVADLCAALNKGRSPEQILSWRKAAAAKIASARVAEPVAALPTRYNRAHRGRSRQDDGADDPAARRGQGLKARRRAQWRRAAARKKAAGLKRISLVVPKVLRATILAILAQIVAGLKEGLLPTVETTRSGSAETTGSRPEETRAEASGATSSCVATSPGTGERDAKDAVDGEVPTRQTEDGPTSRVPLPGNPWGLPPHGSVLSGTEPRWREASRLADLAAERSPLFDDIHMLDWLASLRLPTSGTGG